MFLIRSPLSSFSSPFPSSLFPYRLSLSLSLFLLFSFSLFDSLLALFGVQVPRCAEAALVPRHEGAEQLVLPHVGDGVLVALRGPGPRVEFRPVDLGESQLVTITFLSKM